LSAEGWVPNRDGEGNLREPGSPHLRGEFDRRDRDRCGQRLRLALLRVLDVVHLADSAARRILFAMHEAEPWATGQRVTDVVREAGGVDQEPVDVEIVEQPRVARGPEGNGSIARLFADVTPRGRGRISHDADAVSAHECLREGADDPVSDELPVLVIVDIR